jgi:hypothetical protein
MEYVLCFLSESKADLLHLIFGKGGVLWEITKI